MDNQFSNIARELGTLREKIAQPCSIMLWFVLNFVVHIVDLRANKFSDVRNDDANREIPKLIGAAAVNIYLTVI